MGVPQNVGPAFVDATNDAQDLSTQQPTQIVTDNNTIYIAQSRNGTSGNLTELAVYKPTTAAMTAFTELNAAGSPSNQNGAAFLDTANRQLICGLVLITSPQTAQSLFLQNFSTATETWGAAYATGGPNCLTLVQAVYKRPDSSIVLIYKNATQGGGTTNLRAAVWNGSSWSSSIDVGTGILAFDATGNINVNNTVSSMDSTGLIHLAFINNSGSDMIYQQLKTDNTLGNSHHWTTTSLSMSNASSGLGNMVLSGSNILFSYASNSFTNNALQLGTPLSNPSWSTITPSSLTQPSGQVNFAGNFITDGTNLLWMINSLDASFTYTFFQLARSTDNGNTWTILSDNVTANYFYNFAPGGSTQAPNTDPTFGTISFQAAIFPFNGNTTIFGFCNVHNSSSGVFCGYLLNSESLGPAPPPPAPFPVGTLRYEIPKKRWFPHSYADTIVTHYLDETFLKNVDNEQLLMLSSTLGFIYRDGGDTDNGTAITSIVTSPSMDGGDIRIQKLYVDVMTDLDGTGTATAYAQFNNQTINGANVSYTPTGSRIQQLQNISSLAALNLYRNIAITYQWTGGPDGPRLYRTEPAGYSQPYVSTFYVTQFINLAFPGWKHHRWLYAGYISNNPILFTIKTQDGRTYGPYTLPTTNGQFQIVPFRLDQGIKDLAFAYQIDGQGNNFVLFTDAWTVETKEWTEPSYIPLAIFRT